LQRDYKLAIRGVYRAGGKNSKEYRLKKGGDRTLSGEKSGKKKCAAGKEKTSKVHSRK